jgi:hypothetical protein
MLDESPAELLGPAYRRAAERARALALAAEERADAAGAEVADAEPDSAAAGDIAGAEATAAPAEERAGAAAAEVADAHADEAAPDDDRRPGRASRRRRAPRR